MLRGSAASTQPRLTARLVEPTPPVAPATAMTRAAADLPSPRAKAVVADAVQRADQVFDSHRLRQEFFGAGPHGAQDQVAVGRRADDQNAALGRRLVQLLDQLQGLFGVVVERRRCRCRDASGRRRRQRTRSASTPLRARPCPCPSSIDFSESREASLGSTIANRRTLLMMFPFALPPEVDRRRPSGRPTPIAFRCHSSIALTSLRHNRWGQ